MLDQYNRKIDYLRVSVTDHCNLKCRYCIPEDGAQLCKSEDLLSFEEIVNFCRVAVQKGIKKIRLTGGEPLVRKGITQLVAMIKAIDGLEELCMTTNGILLEKFANDLAHAGLDRINVSLDTLDPVRYKEITRGGDIYKVLRGLDAAKLARLTPIKINCVIQKDSSEDDAQKISAFAKINNYNVCFIRQMDMRSGSFWPAEGSLGGHCQECNRLRLTCQGTLRPCLFSDIQFNIKNNDPHRIIDLALQNKPRNGEKNSKDLFYTIGG